MIQGGVRNLRVEHCGGGCCSLRGHYHLVGERHASETYSPGQE